MTGRSLTSIMVLFLFNIERFYTASKTVSVVRYEKGEYSNFLLPRERFLVIMST